MAVKWIVFLTLFAPWLLVDLWLLWVVLGNSGPATGESAMNLWAFVAWSFAGFVVFGVWGLLAWLL